MRRRSVVCLLFFALTAVCTQRGFPAFAADAPVTGELPSADTLEDMVKAATGKRPDNERLVISQHLHGRDGNLTQFRIGKTFREIDVLGPFTTERGSLDGKDWHTNDNGELVPEEPDAGLSAKDTYKTTVSLVTKPINAYVIARLNASGTGTRRFVDPATHNVVRIERIYSAQTVTTTYDDFRTTNGYTRPWHWTTGDGEPADAGEYNVTALDFGSVTAPDVAEPQSRRIVSFPAGAQQVDLPVTMHDGKFIVHLTINGRGLDFILDTGAAGIVIDDDVASSLGLHIEDQARNGSNAGSYTAGRAIVPRIDIGPISMNNVAVSTSPHLNEESPGVFKSVGLLGFDFISNMELVLDYGEGKVTAYAPDVVAAPEDPHLIVVPIRIGAEVPFADVTVNGALGERFVIDTGAADVGFLVFDYFARRYPDAIKQRAADDGLILTGVGGKISFLPFRAKTVKIANVTFHDLTGYRVTGRSYGAADDGAIGPTFLRFFTVYLDYGSGQMILIPNARGRAAMGIK